MDKILWFMMNRTGFVTLLLQRAKKPAPAFQKVKKSPPRVELTVKRLWDG